MSITKEQLNNPKWRLNNLYYIRDESGKKVKFKMRPVQEELFDNLWYRNVIPKSRQHGITTLMALVALDQCIFKANYSASIIAHNQASMKKIFKNTIKFAWDSFNPTLKHAFSETTTDNAQELTFGNGSSVNVTLSTRSGTPQFLHISELGPIDYKSPEKADEIRSGALNSSHIGNMVTIESTSKGTTGLFAETCFKAKELFDSGAELTPLDFKLFFFPWWKDPKNAIPDEYMKKFVIRESTRDYFREIMDEPEVRKSGHTFTENQMAWWQIKYDEQRDRMNEEQPSTFNESFSTIVENAYYKNEIERAYQEGRIRDISIKPDEYVYTAWDLGMDDLNPIIFFQFYNDNIYIIDSYIANGMGLEHYAKVLESKGYRYGAHFLPHDIEVREIGSGKTRLQILYDLGLRNIIVQKHHKTKEGENFLSGIDTVRRTFSRLYFDQKRTDRELKLPGGKSVYGLLTSLKNYEKEISKQTGLPTGTHKRNGCQHWADALRVLCTTFSFSHRQLSIDASGRNAASLTQSTSAFDF